MAVQIGRTWPIKVCADQVWFDTRATTRLAIQADLSLNFAQTKIVWSAITKLWQRALARVPVPVAFGNFRRSREHNRHVALLRFSTDSGLKSSRRSNSRKEDRDEASRPSFIKYLFSRAIFLENSPDTIGQRIENSEMYLGIKYIYLHPYWNRLLVTTNRCEMKFLLRKEVSSEFFLRICYLHRRTCTIPHNVIFATDSIWSFHDAARVHCASHFWYFVHVFLKLLDFRNYCIKKFIKLQ